MPTHDAVRLATFDTLHHGIENGTPWLLGAHLLFEDLDELQVTSQTEEPHRFVVLSGYRQGLPIFGILRFAAIDEISHGKRRALVSPQRPHVPESNALLGFVRIDDVG